jgi:hypothetical protein
MGHLLTLAEGGNVPPGSMCARHETEERAIVLSRDLEKAFHGYRQPLNGRYSREFTKQARVAMMRNMSSGQEWDLTVPDDDAALLAELHRRGVRPGQRLHVVVSESDDDARPRHTGAPAFFASFAGPRDLAERSSEILAAEFPGDR